MIDVLVLLVCGVAAVVGWRKGVLLTVLPLVGLVAAYAAAFTLYRPLAAPLTDRGAPTFLAYGAAGLAIFLVIVTLFRGLVWWVRRRRAAGPSEFELALGGQEKEFDPDGEAGFGQGGPGDGRGGGRGRALADGLGGAVLSALWAFGVVMVVVWAAESVVALRGSEARSASFAGRTGGRLVGEAVERVTASRLGDAFTASTAGALFRDPGAFRRMLDDLAGKEDFRRLTSDPETLRLLAEGRVAELARRPELGRLLEDPKFRDALRRVGVVGKDPISADELAAALTASLGPVAGVVESLRADGELGAAVERLDLARRLKDGRLMGVLTDADFPALAGRLADGLRHRAP